MLLHSPQSILTSWENSSLSRWMTRGRETLLMQASSKNQKRQSDAGNTPPLTERWSQNRSCHDKPKECGDIGSMGWHWPGNADPNAAGFPGAVPCGQVLRVVNGAAPPLPRDKVPRGCVVGKSPLAQLSLTFKKNFYPVTISCFTPRSRSDPIAKRWLFIIFCEMLTSLWLWNLFRVTKTKIWGQLWTWKWLVAEMYIKAFGLTRANLWSGKWELYPAEAREGEERSRLINRMAWERAGGAESWLCWFR